MRRTIGRAALARPLQLAALPIAAIALTGASGPTGGDPHQRAFVLSNIYFAAAPEDGVCQPIAAGALESFLASLSADEQAALSAPGKRAELEKLMGERLGFRRMALRAGNSGGRSASARLPADLAPGATPTPEQVRAIARLNDFPKGRGALAFQNHVIAYDSCTNPEDFPQLAKGYRTYDGATAFGMNLDDKAGRAGFTGPDGESGVDNQLWRAIGCVAAFRESGNPATAKGTMFSARAPTLIAISGIDDPRNDSDVTVTVMASADAITKNAVGGALARATFDADPDPALRATTRGRIVDGVLTTDPFDIRLNYKEQILDAPRILKGARIRATLQDDGGIEGGFYGYYTLASFYSSIEQMTVNGANLSRVSCPGVRQAIDKLADGYRDPRTGRFTAISSALGFFGVAAFVNDGAQAAR
ncbi:hypothetical protein SAMN06295912_10461 [Sphingomonas laterariae]|uniref:Uncharacterized protein n=1 Tax=Edaphosphingomonas laterariae TaxID=861865 RepID=A0A239DFL7_9SPHN|nr:hypothetical protein [Sphingomonas laterariae]SNS30671.1 hypothetical protein SAMN06295912_10461 [Sphingomonas laterariae]